MKSIASEQNDTCKFFFSEGRRDNSFEEIIQSIFFFSFSRYVFSVIFFLYLYASSLIAVSIFMEVYLVHRTELKIACRGRVNFDNIVLIDRDSSCRAALAFALAKIMNE